MLNHVTKYPHFERYIDVNNYPLYAQAPLLVKINININD